MGMSAAALRCVLVGHVDHGKSTLIGRILLETKALPAGTLAEIRRVSKELGKDAELAFLTDQLQEERQREMTMDTTQRFFRTRRRPYVLIDAPGHAELIKHMLTGATLAEAAVLVVDVQHGAMEQTRRHAYLLDLLGLTRMLVAVTKMDTVAYDRAPFAQADAQIRAVLGGLGLTPACVIPISAREGINIGARSRRMRWYAGPTLLQALDRLEPGARADLEPFRFPVQDVYDVDGTSVLVGRVVSGTVSLGQRVVALPSMEETRIRAIKVFGQHPVKAQAGACVGLHCVPVLRLGRGHVLSEVRRTPRVSCEVRGKVFWLCDQPLTRGAAVRLRCTTQDAEAVVERIEGRVDSATLQPVESGVAELRRHEVGTVTLRTPRPLAVEASGGQQELGRFVLDAGDDVRGVGTILD